MRKKNNDIVKASGNQIISAFVHFFRHEVTSSTVLLLCAVLAMIIANSSLFESYEDLLHKNITIGMMDMSLSMSLLHWINDGLMAVFFFVIGMEVKREFLFGELKSLSATILPIVAAIGGMVVPAVIYALVNWNEPTLGGWGIPMATDIAFALGLLSFAAGNAPRSIAIFLTALAIVDDLGAIVVIALFYTNEISWLALLSGGASLGVAFLLNRWNVKFISCYIFCGIIAWYCFLQAGIHPTIAGVMLGLLIPANGEHSMLHKLESVLVKWSSYAIMPLFALGNAGIPIDGGDFGNIFTPVGLGILMGLCLGKPIGIFASAYLLIKLKLIKMPERLSFPHFLGAGTLGGIGFTMSLFIASLAFSDPHILVTAKLSIIFASVLSALIGIVIFKTILVKNRQNNSVD
jgi:NhaA family Na+:H+ antiporter